MFLSINAEQVFSSQIWKLNANIVLRKPSKQTSAIAFVRSQEC